MVSERLRYRLGLRSSNAAVPYRDRYRECKSGDGQARLAVAEALEDWGDYEDDF